MLANLLNSAPLADVTVIGATVVYLIARFKAAHSAVAAKAIDGILDVAVKGAFRIVAAHVFTSQAGSPSLGFKARENVFGVVYE